MMLSIFHIRTRKIHKFKRFSQGNSAKESQWKNFRLQIYFVLNSISGDSILPPDSSGSVSVFFREMHVEMGLIMQMCRIVFYKFSVMLSYLEVIGILL